MTRTLALSFIALAGTACMHGAHAGTSSASQPATAAAAPAAPAGGDMSAVCPMNVPGTRVTAEDTATGETLTFTSTPDQAQALQARVHAMADMHNRRHAGQASHGGTGGMHHGMMGGMHGGHAGHATPGDGASGGGMAGMMPPAAHAAVEDLPDGARLVLTPRDPADLPRLQQTVRMHAQQMQQHGCAAMQHPHG